VVSVDHSSDGVQEVRWSVDGQAVDSVQEVVQCAACPRVDVSVRGPNGAQFDVSGLAATPWTLRALIPVALWAGYAEDLKT